MPCLEVSMPATNLKTRETLVNELTAAFAESTSFPSEIFGIRFHEYELNYAASGGRMITQAERPYVHFVLYSPRITREAKQKLVERFTQAYTRVMDQPTWHPVIHISEHPYDNVGVEGKLLSDAYEQLRERKFYYDMDRD